MEYQDEDNSNSPEGIFAIIDENHDTVFMLYLYSAVGDMTRLNRKWDFLLLSEVDLLEGAIQIPVTDAFIDLWDYAEAAEIVLMRADAERYELS